MTCAVVTRLPASRKLVPSSTLNFKVSFLNFIFLFLLLIQMTGTLFSKAWKLSLALIFIYSMLISYHCFSSVRDSIRCYRTRVWKKISVETKNALLLKHTCLAFQFGKHEVQEMDVRTTIITRLPFSQLNSRHIISNLHNKWCNPGWVQSNFCTIYTILCGGVLNVP